MILFEVVWNYSHSGCCGCDQAEGRMAHGWLGRIGNHEAHSTAKSLFTYVLVAPHHITVEVQQILYPRPTHRSPARGVNN